MSNTKCFVCGTGGAHIDFDKNGTTVRVHSECSYVLERHLEEAKREVLKTETKTELKD